jgi:4-amino-4-deoxy-L-arabinose transferase-like glycosyltransferase
LFILNRHSARRFRTELALILLVLVSAAALRITTLTRVPPGFSQDEIRNIQVVETVRRGTVASFYNVGDPAGGYEGLYAVFQAVTTTLIGDGLLCYRIFSMWCGLLSVALMYALARRLFGSFVGLTAALALTVTLWPVLLARSAIRETLLLPLTLALLLALVQALHLRRTIEPDPPVTTPYAWVGVLMVAMVYTHWTGLMALPLLVVFIAYLVATRQPISRRVLNFSAFSIIVALILGIPYIVFTLRSLSLSGFRTFWANRPENIGAVINTTFKAVSSLFLVGDPLPEHNLTSSALIGPLGAILLIIGLVVAVRCRRSPNMFLMLLTLVIGLLPDAWTRGEPNFAHSVLALPALMALIGLGADAVVQRIAQAKYQFVPLRDRRVFLATALIAIVSLLLVSQTIFQDWAKRPDVDMAFRGRLGRLAAYLDRTNDQLTTSICTLNLGNAYEASGTNNVSSPSDPALLDLMMHRQDPNVRFSDCMTGFVLTQGGATQRIAYADMQAVRAMPPEIKDWLTRGELIEIDGLSPGVVVKINVEKELADMGGRFTLASAAWEPETSGTSKLAALPVRMGGYLTFEGYALPSGANYKPGELMTLVTYWRADGPQAPDLRIFVHVLPNPTAVPAAQNDTLSVNASLLRDRDVFIQILHVPLPPEISPGDYMISIGAYQNTSGVRLPVYDDNRERGDRLFLDTITVKESQ